MSDFLLQLFGTERKVRSTITFQSSVLHSEFSKRNFSLKYLNHGIFLNCSWLQFLLLIFLKANYLSSASTIKICITFTRMWASTSSGSKTNQLVASFALKWFQAACATLRTWHNRNSSVEKLGATCCWTACLPTVQCCHRFPPKDSYRVKQTKTPSGLCLRARVCSQDQCEKTSGGPNRIDVTYAFPMEAEKPAHECWISRTRGAEDQVPTYQLDQHQADAWICSQRHCLSNGGWGSIHRPPFCTKSTFSVSFRCRHWDSLLFLWALENLSQLSAWSCF